MRAKKIAKVMAVIALGCVLTATLLEGGLRLVKYARRIGPEWDAKKSADVIRIVTLGESTTASYAIGQRRVDWPYQLETRMNSWLEGEKSQLRVRVYNLARSAASSPFLVSILEERAEALDPEVLITMLGVNDSNVVPIERSWWYRNFLSVRLYHWAEIAWLCPACYDVEFSKPPPPEPAGLIAADREVRAAAIALLNKDKFEAVADVDRFAAAVAELQEQSGEHQHWMNASLAGELFRLSQFESFRLKFPAAQKRVMEFAEELLRKSYREMVLRDPWTLEYFCHLGNVQGKPMCLSAVKDALANGIAVTPQLLTLAAQSGGQSDRDLQRVFRASGFDFTKENSEARSIHASFLRLQNFVEKNHVIWFAMQYPTGSVEALKYYLSDASQDAVEAFGQNFYLKKSPAEPAFQNVTYISNENFTELVHAGKTSDYFVDMFARQAGMEFGHTNEKGNGIIADNAAKALKAAWPRIVASAAKRNRDGAR